MPCGWLPVYNVCHHVVTILGCNHLCCSVLLVLHPGVSPGLQQQGGDILPAQHGSNEEWCPAISLPLLIYLGSWKT